ncbi:MAG: DUF4255 domain-containing protein [Actinomycetota bacterium]|nr:DUF4255 domain-containing protein [Actinomycetota bacterium]
MIHEVDQALMTLIRRESLTGNGVEVVLDAPTRDWAARRNAPTLDVYLYDIREDLRRRERGVINEYGDDGHVARRRLPPRYVKLAYLVTAWTQRPEDEHRLLSAVLACFLRHEKLPDDTLTGGLADLHLPVAVTVAIPPPEDRSWSDVWSALGGDLKPSLDVQVSAPVDTGVRYEAAPLVLEDPRFDLNGESGPRGRRGRGAGRAAAARRLAEETVQAGKPGKPGRILRVSEK